MRQLLEEETSFEEDQVRLLPHVSQNIHDSLLSVRIIKVLLAIFVSTQIRVVFTSAEFRWARVPRILRSDFKWDYKTVPLVGKGFAGGVEIKLETTSNT